MNNLKKIMLLIVFSLSSVCAQAELKPLDDVQMDKVTGQSGITIDLAFKWSIGEFLYQDAGKLITQGVRVGGSKNNLKSNDYIDLKR